MDLSLDTQIQKTEYDVECNRRVNIEKSKSCGIHGKNHINCLLGFQRVFVD